AVHLDNREVEIARVQLAVTEREKQVKVKHGAVAELKSQIDNELSKWEADLTEREKRMEANAEHAASGASQRAMATLASEQRNIDRQLKEVLTAKSTMRVQEADLQRRWAQLRAFERELENASAGTHIRAAKAEALDRARINGSKCAVNF
ncbi:hypothetical protein T484DRAFT_1850935, partial [Baffinella frigidus]